MSIQSMTGFGKAQTETNDFIISVEIKSVNNRFKDFRFKIPANLNSLENELKKELNEVFSRGTFDIYVSIKKSENKSRFDDLDLNKVNAFIEKLSPVFKTNGLTPQVHLTDFLRSEFYLEQEEEIQDVINATVIKTFKAALADLKKSRLSEGEKLVTVLLKHLNTYTEYFKTIEANANHFKSMIEEKLMKRVDEYKNTIAVDQSRLLQEVVFYLEKIDIHEEINRVHAHLEKFQNLLKSSNEVGRQIDFFIQELNRETNTMGSKSSMKEISDAVVQMKVQLEKMREQGLNIE